MNFAQISACSGQIAASRGIHATQSANCILCESPMIATMRAEDSSWR